MLYKSLFTDIVEATKKPLDHQEFLKKLKDKNIPKDVRSFKNLFLCRIDSDFDDIRHNNFFQVYLVGQFLIISERLNVVDVSKLNYVFY